MKSMHYTCSLTSSQPVPAGNRLSPRVLRFCFVAAFLYFWIGGTCFLGTASLSLHELTAENKAVLDRYGITVKVSPDENRKGYHDVAINVKNTRLIEKGLISLTLKTGESEFSTSWSILPKEPLAVQFTIDEKSVSACFLTFLVAEIGRTHIEDFDYAYNIDLKSFDARK